MDREEAINILHGIRADNLNLDDAYTKDKYEALNMAIEALENQKTGHWIELGCVGNDNYDFKCSECNHSDTHSKAVKVNYCWFCGAKME